MDFFRLCSFATDLYREYTSSQITKRIVLTSFRKKNTLVVDTIKVHSKPVDKETDTQFIVTMDCYHLNALLAIKLKSEGFFNEANELEKRKPKYIEKGNKKVEKENIEQNIQTKATLIQNKSLSPTSKQSDRQIIVNYVDKHENRSFKSLKQTDECNNTIIEKSVDGNKKRKRIQISFDRKETPIKKIKASPMVVCVEKEKIEEQLEGARTESAGSGNSVTVTINSSATKYCTMPPSSAATKPVTWCRAFPLCRFGSACVYSHPRCKFAAACRRRNCVYSHSSQAKLARVNASHVVTSANYKSTSQCKFFPNCLNPACHFYHPKPCRYGKSCLNKLWCYFYHNDDL